MDIRKIESFLCAAETSNLTEAAKLLHLSQPAVSHQIKLLEEELEVRLFVRTSTGLKLTEAGHILLPFAKRLSYDTNEIRKMMSSLKDREAGDLCFACSSTSGRFILPHIVARFRIAYPDVSVRILACQPKNMVAKLLESQAHLGVVSSEPTEPNLQSQVFFRDPIGLIVPAGHRWAGKRSIDPAEILQERIIIREETAGTRRVMLAELAKFDIGIDDLDVFLEVGNTEAALELVAGGYGISFVSCLASRYLLELGKVISIPVQGLEMERINYLVRKHPAPPHRAGDVFWGFIHAPENADILPHDLVKQLT